MISIMELYNNNSLDIFAELIDKYKNENVIIVTDPPFNINYKYSLIFLSHLILTYYHLYQKYNLLL